MMKKNIMKVTALALTLSTLFAGTALAEGWGKVGSQWFYYNEDSTVAKNTWIPSADGSTSYWVRNDGVMATSEWISYEDVWYYADANGNILKNQMLKLNNDIYWLDEDGRMIADNWAHDTENNKWYYMEADGRAVKNGWKQIDGDYYYFLKSGVMASDALVPGGYRVGPDGKWQQN